jgi:thioredoxin 1
MKQTTRNYLALGFLVAAVVGMMMFNRVRSGNLAADLPDDSIVAQGKPVLLQLGAHWCPPCRKQLPVMVELGHEQDAFSTAYLDVDEHPGKARNYGVSSIPVLIFFDAEGRELFRHVGFFPKDEILAQWKKLGIQTPSDSKTRFGKHISNFLDFLFFRTGRLRRRRRG